MTTKLSRWTKEEDEILVRAIKANPHNKVLAFRKVAVRINRTEAAVSYRWYNILSNPKHKNYVGCMFTMIGVSSKLDNRTVNRENVHITPTKIKKGLWAKVKDLLGI